MAAHGYEDERFESVVSKRFHCPICFNVFKDPVMCRRNQHPFCRGCVSRHLGNSRTCPNCKDELTFDTLSPAPRILTDYLSELKIRCEFFLRGCKEFIELQNLERHIETCGYAPEVCSNDGCQLEINKRDLIHHESVECEERKLKCHHCERMSEDVAKLKRKVGGLEKTFGTAYESVYGAVEAKLDSFQKNMDRNFEVLKKSCLLIQDDLKELRNDGVSSPKKSRLEIDCDVEQGDDIQNDGEEDDDDNDESDDYDSPASSWSRLSWLRRQSRSSDSPMVASLDSSQESIFQSP